MMQTTQQRLSWSWSGDPAFVAVVDKAIWGWYGTRYMTGQQIRGVHADCVRYGSGIYDDLYGWRRELPRNLALDSAIHNPAEAWAQLRRLLEVYPEAKPLHADVHGVWHVEPADCVVTGTRKGGPGHFIMVGARPNTCWEAPCPRQPVREIGIGLHPGLVFIKHAFRMRDRLSWVRP